MEEFCRYRSRGIFHFYSCTVTGRRVPSLPHSQQSVQEVFGVGWWDGIGWKINWQLGSKQHRNTEPGNQLLKPTREDRGLLLSISLGLLSKETEWVCFHVPCLDSFGMILVESITNECTTTRSDYTLSSDKFSS